LPILPFLMFNHALVWYYHAKFFKNKWVLLILTIFVALTGFVLSKGEPQAV
jgi:hypothetical protein